MQALPANNCLARIGPYALEKELQRLERHSLYLAHHVESGNPVLIEVLSSKANGDPERRAEFLLEAQVACGADPTRVVPRNVFQMNGRLHALFDWPPGRTLSALSLPLDVDEAIDVCIDVAIGLSSIHRQGIVHGAIRTDGVIVHSDEEGEHAKLLDVGYCLRAGRVRLEDVPSNIPLAPENLHGAPMNRASDVYGFGALSFELLSGVPWRARHLHELPAYAPEELVDLVQRCLAASPKERPAGMEEAVHVLRRLRRRRRSRSHQRQESGGDPSKPGDPPVPKEPPRGSPDLSAFGEHARWFIEDGARLSENQLASLCGYRPQRGAGRVRSGVPAWVPAVLAFLLLPALGVLAYLVLFDYDLESLIGMHELGAAAIP